MRHKDKGRRMVTEFYDIHVNTHERRVQVNSTYLKFLATALNKSKKRKGFFLLDLKRSYIARVTSVASAERDASLMDAKSMLFF
jgi:hypothetical protein